jgi:hypothetical protein
VAVLVANSWRFAEARRALLYGGGCMLAFAAAFHDADLAQRIVLGPGLLFMAVAAHVASRTSDTWPVRTLVPVVVLSAIQIARSALLYLSRTPTV